MEWRTTMHANGHLTIFHECLYMYYSWKIFRKCLHAWLFSNPCWQVLKSIKSRIQICPILLRRKRTFPHKLENNHACNGILDNFPGLICMSAFLKNCQKSICMHGCSPIHVERSYALLEFHGVWI